MPGGTRPTRLTGLFQCHQSDADSAVKRVCAGWAGCHESEELLALRLGLFDGRIDAATYRAAIEYVWPVSLLPSGGDTAAHGEAGVDASAQEARRVIDKIARARNDTVP